MNNAISIDASKARNDFLKLLDKVYLQDKSFIVKKSGIPVATIVKFENTARPRNLSREDHFDSLRRKYGYPLEGVDTVEEIRKMRRTR